MGITASVGKFCCASSNTVDPKLDNHECSNTKSVGVCSNINVIAPNKMSSLTLDRIGHAADGDNGCPSRTSGLDHLRQAGLNKGMAFTLEERQALGIHGLLPVRVKTQEEQLQHCRACLDRLTDDLNKYIYLMGLLDSNEKLFFRLVTENTDMILPLVYTPTVGQACQKFGLVYRRPRGLFITIHDRGHVYEILRNWPESDVRAIVVTDGERILGLGDLGACGMGIPIGKLALYTGLAGIKPHQCLPITLDVGTNTEAMLNDPLYIGLKQKRVTGEKYDELLDEFMQAVVNRFGRTTLIQFEDFGNSNAFRLLQKYRDRYCTFNDDIQGTAGVAVAGLLASLRITKKKLSDNVIVFQGAGEASLGIAQLLVMAMTKEGTTASEALDKIWMVDSKGLIVKNRPGGGLTEHKLKFARDDKPIKTLHEVVQTANPSVIIGASTIAGSFTSAIIKHMAQTHERPVIFALSNPTNKSECTAEEAYTYSNGKAIFSSGSPFPPFTINGKTLQPGQGNNSYIFPGVALGIISVGMQIVPEETFIVAAQTLAELVADADLDVGRVYPPLSKIQDCSVKIATKVAEFAYTECIASVHPQPENLEKFIRAQMYDTHYQPALPSVYPYPKL
ncbi:hypothetical protein FQA39_LY09974 [Lamprigera yunnana]|nr:hypothetical protein FQA39_LY09974 [Lamprigera yunnana]